MSPAKKLLEELKQDIKAPQQKVGKTYLQLVEIFPLQTIDSKELHENALKVLNKIIFYYENQNEDKSLNLYVKTLSDLIADYERVHFKFEKSNGAEMLAYIMELQGFNQTDLAKDLGGQSVVSKILKGERDLNLRQIKALAKRFNVSPEVFI